MHALVLQHGALRFRSDHPEPSPRTGESLVAVHRAGVCATDLALARGYMGFRGVPGHEFVGVALDGPLVGRRVVGEINAGCGVCSRCLAGDPRHCERRSVLGILGRDGAFAERLALPTVNLLEVPDAVADDAALLTEPLAAAFGVVERLGGVLPEQALVIGDGRLGSLCALALCDAGAKVDVLGRHFERQALFDGARTRPGHVPRHLGRPLDDEPLGATDARYGLVVEASGRSDLLAAAARRVEPRGTLVLKTTTERAVPIDTAPWVVDEIAVVGSRCGRFAPALEALARGLVPHELFIAERYALRDGERAFERAARGGVLKVAIDILGR
ncbi:2-deoxy-scyllo-inosamine dehydrogenase [Planctomycetes bacterium Pla163]|uniref:2-deoxy-scyllo-inosamine dehydrogenase n=1 Tax=Rohdeia mirabilis TaxID=2528008 RepID=A0A518D0L3_9BACT|nr:2-deoxy-scyllo-inosamine dehydrogenase [Planctomycetes bacterium Pla163]